MIQRKFLFYLFPLIVLFLSFPSITETNVPSVLIYEKLTTFMQFDTDYALTLVELNNQVGSFVKIPEDNEILMEQFSEKLKYLSEQTEKFSEFNEKTPISKSIKDMLKEVEMRLWINFLFSTVETGLMINGLVKTCNIIKQSREIRESNILQETTIKINKHLVAASDFFQKADSELFKIEIQWDIPIESILLREIYLDLREAQQECQRAQDVLKTILKDIQHTHKSLISAQSNHWTGFCQAMIRLIYIIYELVMSPMTSLMNIRNIFSSLNAGMQLANTVGHARGYYWTRDEIQNLEMYQHKFDKLEMLIKYSSNRINLGCEILNDFTI